MNTQEENNIRSRFKGGRALGHVERLCEIGDRFVGSEGDRRAMDYVVGHFKGLGLRVEFTEIEVPTFRVERCEATLLPEGLSLDAIPPYFSPSTPDGGVEAGLVFAGGGREEDYDGLDVRGRIVVLQESGLGYSMFWLGTFAQRAARHGAIALIVIHPLPWPYRMSMEAGNSDLSRRFLPEALPAISVSSIQGGLIMRALGRGDGRARLRLKTAMPMVKSSIISGFLDGDDLSPERVAVMAHRDNGISPGANDNGSGSGTMLELARVFAGLRPRRTIEFISSTAEEGVTSGASQYCQAHRADLTKMMAYLDTDMFGTGGRINLVETGLWPDHEPLKQPEWLMRILEEIAEELGYHLGRMTATWGVAESGRFIEAGVPSAWFWAPDDFYYHSVHDSADKIDGNRLKAVGDICAVALWRLANPS